MSSISRLVVPIDGSPLAERALPYAARIARATSAELHLLHVVPDPRTAFLAGPPLESELEAHDKRVALARRELDYLAARIPLAETVRFVAGVRSGDPAAQILRDITESSTDLVVMSTHGHSGGMRVLYGSVAEDLLRKSNIPMILIPPWCSTSWPESERLAVMVALDGSELAEQALPAAISMCEALSAVLHLVEVVDPTHFINGESSREGADAYLRSAIQKMAYARDVRIDVRRGAPADQITAAAREAGAHVIAMATHGRTGLARLLMGSVANATLRLAQVPLLLVRPPTMRDGPFPRSPSM